MKLVKKGIYEVQYNDEKYLLYLESEVSNEKFLSLIKTLTLTPSLREDIELFILDRDFYDDKWEGWLTGVVDIFRLGTTKDVEIMSYKRWWRVTDADLSIDDELGAEIFKKFIS